VAFRDVSLRQPLNRQACRNGVYARFDADRCDACGRRLLHMVKIEASEVQILLKWSVSMQIHTACYRYLPSGITWD
jgi:hypothetical protein